jgi:hypothetical protein
MLRAHIPRQRPAADFISPVHSAGFMLARGAGPQDATDSSFLTTDTTHACGKRKLRKGLAISSLDHVHPLAARVWVFAAAHFSSVNQRLRRLDFVMTVGG